MSMTGSTNGITVHTLSPDDPVDLLERALAVHNAVETELDPDRDPHKLAAFRTRIGSTETFGCIWLLAEIDGEAAGLAELHWNAVEGNNDKTEIGIEVAPQFRRRGVGTRLLEHSIDRARSLGHTSVLAFGALTEPVNGFWETYGAPMGLEERISRLWVRDTDPELMQQWVDARHARAGDYTLHHWQGPCPDEHVAAMAALYTAMNDAPMDDIDWDDEVWTEQAVRDVYDLFALREAEPWTSIVMSPDGEPAGLTVVVVPTHDPKFSYQEDTVVIDAHRNRGIGRWLKADMWQRLTAGRPEVESLETENAESNDPMLGINVAMGFKPLLSAGCWQADYDTITAAINSHHP